MDFAPLLRYWPFLAAAVLMTLSLTALSILFGALIAVGRRPAHLWRPGRWRSRSGCGRPDRDGFVHAPPGPGLGIGIDWAAITSASIGCITSGRRVHPR